MIGIRLRIARQALLAGMVAYSFAPYAMAKEADAGVWTLQRSIARAMAIAPEIKEAEADIQAGRSDVMKAGEWPNPSVSINVNSDIRGMYNESGYTLESLIYSQPIPLGRLEPQKEIARQGMLATQADAAQIRLDVEARTARLFLSLQADHDKLQLAEQRQKFTHRLIRSLRKLSSHAGLVRYTKPLERARLQLLAETADAAAAAARDSYQEDLDKFRNYLALPADMPVRLSAMRPATAPAPLPVLRRRLDTNATRLRRLRHRLKAAEAGVALQKVRRFDDPVLSFVHGRNVNIYNFSYSYNGIQLSVSLPLWDRNTGNILKARADVMRNRSRLEIAKRDLVGQLDQNHMHLQHLLYQASHFREHVLGPAHQFLRDTERHYDVGAATGLALIDAYNTYFSAKSRYLDLLFRSQRSAIALRQLLGSSLVRQDNGEG